MLLAASAGSAALADDPPPLFSVSARNTTDIWDAATGGLRSGLAVLNKLQVSATGSGDSIGAGGLSVHIQLFRTDGESLSERLGDLQTADSIDARPVTRLFESWIEQKIGGDKRSFALRAGLIDLNADFDSVQTSSLFVNSSQGIGADLARSGRRGPSIYPVSSLGVRASWLPSKSWTFRLAAFDGVPGDPASPGAFVSARLNAADGALLIGQADYHMSDKAKVEAGVWRYTETRTALTSQVGSTGKNDQGAYASIEGPLPHINRWSAWLRAGLADGQAQAVGSYLGLGIVGEAVIPGRDQDRLGLAVARAGISSLAQRTFGLKRAETSYEVTYQYKLRETVAVQPDVQYIEHPSAAPHVANAVAVGIRLVLTTGYPRKAPAAEATDPTVPPEGPQPTDDNGSPSNGPSS